MVNPQISVLIPNYNKSTYLRQTLDSVQIQTFTDWECIIVDDLSTDNSWEILNEYAQRDSRFRIFKRPKHRKHGGNAARNYAIMQASGRYLSFLDSDDLWRPSRLELALNFLVTQNIDSIYSGAVVVKYNSIQMLASRDIKEGESVFDFILSDDVFCPTPSLILKKELAQCILFDEDLKRHQDYDFFIRAHLKSPWKYFENFDVQVNWTRTNFKNINYFNCIPFYEKHSTKSVNKEIRYKYIIRITSSSIRESYKYNLSGYYKDILINERYNFSFREYLMFYFPFLFFLLSKIKWIFHQKFVYQYLKFFYT